MSCRELRWLIKEKEDLGKSYLVQDSQLQEDRRTFTGRQAFI